MKRSRPPLGIILLAIFSSGGAFICLVTMLALSRDE
jgi:hypothetical protein